MCGRFTLRKSAKLIAEVLDAAINMPLYSARFNISPSQQVPVVREEGAGRELCLLRWGLIPSWSKSSGDGFKAINARAEGIDKKPSFRTPFKKRRCLVPADGYYEWLKLGKAKQPILFQLRDERPFAFAGLWDRWQPPEGEALETFAIVTCAASGLARRVHHRMPVILGPDAYPLWLDPAMHEADKLLPLLGPYPKDDLVAVPVSTKVNSPKNEGPERVEPVEDPAVFERVRTRLTA